MNNHNQLILRDFRSIAEEGLRELSVQLRIYNAKIAGMILSREQHILYNNNFSAAQKDNDIDYETLKKQNSQLIEDVDILSEEYAKGYRNLVDQIYGERK